MIGARVILVEGPTDRQALETLLERLGVLADGTKLRLDRDLVIDTAEILDSPEGKSLSNREKVIEVARSVATGMEAKRFVGFIDREFDFFELDANGQIVDEVLEHHCDGRLVWSRGHSIENYFLAEPVLMRAIKASQRHVPAIALKTFQACLQSMLQFACTVALAGRSVSDLESLRAAVQPSVLSIGGNRIRISDKKWRDTLKRRDWCRTKIRRFILESRAWHQKVCATPIDTVRWTCHGKLTLQLMWQTYIKCLEAARDHSAVRQVASASRDRKYTWCIESWVASIEDVEVSFPYPLLGLLDLGISLPRTFRESSPSN